MDGVLLLLEDPTGLLTLLNGFLPSRNREQGRSREEAESTPDNAAGRDSHDVGWSEGATVDRIERRLGRVSCVADSRAEAELQLLVYAYRRGGNCVVRLRSERRLNSGASGAGPKWVTEWTGEAVKVSKSDPCR